MCSALAGLNVRDDRILAALLAYAAHHPDEGLSLLVDYGDPAAGGPLNVMLARRIARGELDAAELIADTITSVGGDVDPEHAARLTALSDA